MFRYAFLIIFRHCIGAKVEADPVLAKDWVTNDEGNGEVLYYHYSKRNGFVKP
jgi:hypothetical protein